MRRAILATFPIGLVCASAVVAGEQRGAPPAAHYVFESFALDAPLDVPAVGASPPQTRAAILAAMPGHVRGKAACVGLFKRTQ